MIVKKVENPRKSASKAVRIEALAAYIRAPEAASGTEKCAYYGARGFLTDDPAVQAIEMIELAEAAARSGDPITHYVLSFGEGERPTPEQIEAAVDIFLEECGRRRGRGPSLHDWTRHQVMYALHSDTGHYHVHLVINRVDPDSERPVEIDGGWDVEVGHRAGVRNEEQQGWRRENNKRYRLGEDGDLVRLTPNATELPRQPTQRQIDAERRTGEPSAARLAIERAGPVIEGAESWADVHSRLRGAAMRYERRGSGAVVMVGDIAVKASRVARRASLRALEARLGAFEPAEREPPCAAHAKDSVALIAAAESWTELHESLAPEGFVYERNGSGAVVRAGDLVWKASEVSRHASVGALERRLGPFEPAPGTPGARDARPSGAEPDLWEQYWTAHVEYSAELARKRREADDERDRELEALRKAYAEERAAIAARDWRQRGEILNLVRATLAHLHREQRKAARVRHREALAAVRAEHPRWPSFPAWLARRAEVCGEAPAELIPRGHRPRKPPTPRRVEGYRSRRTDQRVEYLNRHDEVAFIDRGDKIDVRLNRDEAAVLAALRLAIAQWGTVRANGSLRYRELCARLAKEHELDVMTGLEAAAEQPPRPEATRHTPASTPERVPDPHPPEVVAPPVPRTAREPPRRRTPAFEGRGGSPAVPHDIRGYEAKADGERVLYRRRGAPPGSPAAFRDVGKRVDVLDWQSEESTLAALKLSALKWGEFLVTGDEEFKARCARLAAEHGFRISNPELKETIERERARLDAATKASADPEPSPEPEVALDATHGRTPAPREPPRERDIELETASAPAPPTPRVAEELHDVFAASEGEDAARAIEHYGADAVRLAKEFRRLSEEHGELWLDFNAKDQATGTLRFIDRDGMARHTSRESGIALARMEALLTRRPPEDIPELEREITKTIAQELAQVHERGR